jgi:hypothetical protein
MTNPPLGIFLLVGSQALSYIRQWRSAFGITLKLTTSIYGHGAFPKIDRWSSRIQIRERTLQDRRSGRLADIMRRFVYILRLPSKRHQLKVFRHWAKKILLRLRYSQVLSKQPIESKNTR